MTKRLFALLTSLSLLIGVAVVAPATTQAACANGYAYLWERADGTGTYKAYCLDYVLGYDLGVAKFTDGTWADNRVSSVSYSSGATVGLRVKLYTGYNYVGSTQIVVNNSGSDLDVLNATLNNAASTVQFIGP